MTEQEWLASENPQAMLAFRLARAETFATTPAHLEHLPISPRKLRLFACACCSLVEPCPDEWEEHLPAGWRDLQQWVDTVAREDFGVVDLEMQKRKAALLRCIAGNPFRPVTLDPVWLTDTVRSLAAAAYEERLLPRDCKRCGGSGYLLSGHIDARRCPLCPAHPLDPDRLAILADALEEAGCPEEALLRHLRGQELCWDCLGRGKFRRPPGAWHTDRCEGCIGAGWVPLRGSHVRGCWAVDLLTGRN